MGDMSTGLLGGSSIVMSRQTCPVTTQPKGTVRMHGARQVSVRVSSLGAVVLGIWVDLTR